MKLTKLLSIAFLTAVLGTTACTKNKDVAEVSGGVEAWLSVAIDLSDQEGAMRLDESIGDEGTYEGTVDERKVSDAMLLLYTKDGALKYAVDLDVKTDGTSSFAGNDVSSHVTPTGTTFTTKARKFVKDDYKVIMVLNPTASFKSLVDRKATLFDLNSAQEYKDASVKSANGFFMSNAKGIVELSQSAACWIDETSDSEAKVIEKAEKHADKLQIAVERPMAKVYVSKATIPTVLPSGAKAAIQQFDIDVLNRQFFWVRKMAKDPSGAAETATTPRWRSYAEDPNMAGDFDKHPTTHADMLKYFTYLPTTGELSAQAKEPGLDDEKGIYVPENTMEANQQYEAATSRLVLKVQYTPAGMTEGDSYFVWGGKAFKTDEFATLVAEVRSWHSNHPTATDAEMEAYDAEKLLAIGFTKAVKASGDFTFATDKSYIKEGIQFFKDGINFYAANIRHFNDALQPQAMAYGRYGVVRNNIYKITVNSVKGPGSPLVPTPDKEVPDDKAYSYISVSVTVQPWIVRTQNVDL